MPALCTAVSFCFPAADHQLPVAKNQGFLFKLRQHTKINSLFWFQFFIYANFLTSSVKTRLLISFTNVMINQPSVNKSIIFLIKIKRIHFL